MVKTKRVCEECGKPIHPNRLKALPDTKWCIACAEELVEKVGGNMVWSHKTAPELEIKPMGKAKRFAQQTRRHAFNASLKMGSYKAEMDKAAGRQPFTPKDEED